MEECTSNNEEDCGREGRGEGGGEGRRSRQQLIRKETNIYLWIDKITRTFLKCYRRKDLKEGERYVERLYIV